MYFTGCIQTQLDSLYRGFYNSIPISASKFVKRFHWHDLEGLLCGQSVIDVLFVKSRTTYHGYTASSREVVWFWEVLETLSQVGVCVFVCVCVFVFIERF